MKIIKHSSSMLAYNLTYITEQNKRQNKKLLAVAGEGV